jgi:hypothetical protein
MRDLSFIDNENNLSRPQTSAKSIGLPWMKTIYQEFLEAETNFLRLF